MNVLTLSVRNVYYDEGQKVKGTIKLKNINSQNDANILDKVTFVYGIAEIDKKDMIISYLFII